VISIGGFGRGAEVREDRPTVDERRMGGEVGGGLIWWDRGELEDDGIGGERNEEVKEGEDSEVARTTGA
jgi:hypothetical protein